MLFVGEGQILVEFGKIQMLDRFYRIVCVGIGIFLNASEAGAFISQFVDAVAYRCHSLAGSGRSSKAG